MKWHWKDNFKIMHLYDKWLSYHRKQEWQKTYAKDKTKYMTKMNPIIENTLRNLQKKDICITSNAQSSTIC